MTETLDVVALVAYLTTALVVTGLLSEYASHSSSCSAARLGSRKANSGVRPN